MSLHQDTFNYLQPTEKQLDTMQGVREGFARFAGELERSLPDGADKTYVLRLIRTAGMWAHTAITRNQDGGPRD